MEARFSGCAVKLRSKFFFRLVLVHKKVWCSLSSLSIQTRVLAVTFHITLFLTKFLFKMPINPSCSIHIFYKGKLQSLIKRSFYNG